MSDIRWFQEGQETTRLPLGDTGEWVEVKNHLTIADQLKIQNAGLVALRRQTDGDDPTGASMDIRIDGVRQSLVRMLTYIVRWSAKRKHPKTGQYEAIAVSEESLRMLTPEMYELIDKALDAHIEAMQAGKPSGSSAGEPSSESVDTSA